MSIHGLQGTREVLSSTKTQHQTPAGINWTHAQSPFYDRHEHNLNLVHIAYRRETAYIAP